MACVMLLLLASYSCPRIILEPSNSLAVGAVVCSARTRRKLSGGGGKSHHQETRRPGEFENLFHLKQFWGAVSLVSLKVDLS